MTAMVSRIERHLCVIFAADVAGYSTLMRRDEEGTLAQLVTARQKMDDLVAAHRGRIVNSVGDSVLAEFSSVMDAIQAAIEIQREIDAATAATAPDQRVLFRIGLQLGEVMVRGTDIYGDGVNVAARLQTLADPGGIVVSGTVYDQLRDRLPVPFVDLGEQVVKNIERPVPAFGLTRDAIAALPRTSAAVLAPKPSRNRNRTRKQYAVLALVVLAVCGAGWWALREPAIHEPAPQTAQGTAAERPQVTLLAMSLVIAPLNAPSADAAAALFADALRRDLTTGLSAVERRVTVLSFIADAESNPVTDARGSARRVGARYVVEGDVRSRGDVEIVNLQLIDTEKGIQTWSGQYTFQDADASVEASVARRKLVSQLAASVGDAETRRVLTQPIDRLTATELVLRGWAVYSQASTLANTVEARKLFDAALHLDPNHVWALCSLAGILDATHDIDPHPDRDRIVAEMNELTTRAVQLDPMDRYVWVMRSLALADLGRWNAAFEAIDQAIKVDPYRPSNYSQKAWMMNMTARPAESLKLVDRALALNPDNVGYEMHMQCEAYLLLGQADRAVQACEKASGLRPGDWIVQLFLVAAYANHGDMAQAADAKRAVLRAVPDYTIAMLRAKRYSEVPEYLKLAETYWYAGLRKAGVPEK